MAIRKGADGSYVFMCGPNRRRFQPCASSGKVVEAGAEPGEYVCSCGARLGDEDTYVGSDDRRRSRPHKRGRLIP